MLARVYTVNADATISFETEAKGPAWARTLRDPIEQLLGTERKRIDLGGIPDEVLVEELRATGMEGGADMKAIVIEATGGPEQLDYKEVPEPSPAAGELLVEVAAAGLNYIDTYQRIGLYPMQFPFTPGLEGAGTVLEVGDDAAGFTVGDRVAWVSTLGSYAERQVVPADAAIPVPSSVPLETAAASMLQGITAHYLATDTFPLQPGDRCLVHAGAGGVGLLLTQIAKRRGATGVSRPWGRRPRWRPAGRRGRTMSSSTPRSTSRTRSRA